MIWKMQLLVFQASKLWENMRIRKCCNVPTPNPAKYHIINISTMNGSCFTTPFCNHLWKYYNIFLLFLYRTRVPRMQILVTRSGATCIYFLSLLHSSPHPFISFSLFFSPSILFCCLENLITFSKKICFAQWLIGYSSYFIIIVTTCLNTLQISNQIHVTMWVYVCTCVCYCVYKCRCFISTSHSLQKVKYYSLLVDGNLRFIKIRIRVQLYIDR